MSTTLPALMGSGTIPYTVSILSSGLGGTYLAAPTTGPGIGRGERVGSQILVANPEDIVSVPAFATSGISMPGGTPTEIYSPALNESVLRRRRMIKVQNLGPGDLFIGHTNRVSQFVHGGEPGFKLVPSAASGITSVDLPLMGGASVWGLAVNQNTDVRVLMY